MVAGLHGSLAGSALATTRPSTTLAVGAAVALGAIVLIRLLHQVDHRHGTRRQARARPTPAPFSYWYALVPFEDGPGAKERPVLVLDHDGVHARALKVTSQDRSGRSSYRRLDTSRWDRPGQRRGSWLQVDRVVEVPLSGFRRRLGDEQDRDLCADVQRRHASRTTGRQTTATDVGGFVSMPGTVIEGVGPSSHEVRGATGRSAANGTTSGAQPAEPWTARGVSGAPPRGRRGRAPRR